MANEEVKPKAVKPQEESAKFYVDGKTVDEKTYLDAAEASGYDRALLVSNPGRRPAISTKAHGEK